MRERNRRDLLSPIDKPLDRAAEGKNRSARACCLPMYYIRIVLERGRAAASVILPRERIAIPDREVIFEAMSQTETLRRRKFPGRGEYSGSKYSVDRRRERSNSVNDLLMDAHEPCAHPYR